MLGRDVKRTEIFIFLLEKVLNLILELFLTEFVVCITNIACVYRLFHINTFNSHFEVKNKKLNLIFSHLATS